MKLITIGRLSGETGVKVTTIRYYESIGLMSEPERSSSGQRLYDVNALQRLSFIRHARDLGFPIDSIRELIDLQEEPNQNCAPIDVIAFRQLEGVRDKISKLQALEMELKRIVMSCDGSDTTSCKILESLKDHSYCNGDHDRVSHQIGK